MAQLPRTAVEFKDFMGLVTNANPNDVGPGAAQDQVNACCIRQAELQVRRGYQDLTFED